MNPQSSLPQKIKILILSGPTASGKSLWAIQLAQKLQGHIINFDSLLFYHELTIGCAKPTAKELNLVPHHLINISTISAPLNAADFGQMAREKILELSHLKLPIILVGGSGFYLQALLKGMWNSPTLPEKIRAKSDLLYQQGIEGFRSILFEHDPDSYHRLHPNDHYRIRRAVEHWWNHGTAFSKEKSQFKPLENSWEIEHFYFDLPKDEHFKIIQQRTQKMLRDGLIDEYQELMKNGFTGKERPLLSIGYKEVGEWLAQDGKNLEQLAEQIDIHTRQLAKSQRTWFKKVTPKQTFHPLKDGALILKQAQDFFNKLTE